MNHTNNQLFFFLGPLRNNLPQQMEHQIAIAS